MLSCFMHLTDVLAASWFIHSSQLFCAFDRESWRIDPSVSYSEPTTVSNFKSFRSGFSFQRANTVHSLSPRHPPINTHTHVHRHDVFQWSQHRRRRYLPGSIFVDHTLLRTKRAGFIYNSVLCWILTFRGCGPTFLSLLGLGLGFRVRVRVRDR